MGRRHSHRHYQRCDWRIDFGRLSPPRSAAQRAGHRGCHGVIVDEIRERRFRADRQQCRTLCERNCRAFQVDGDREAGVRQDYRRADVTDLQRPCAVPEHLIDDEVWGAYFNALKKYMEKLGFHGSWKSFEMSYPRVFGTWSMGDGHDRLQTENV